MKLGVCYYPEHWPEAMWADDAARMVALGITKVRIGEFAWSRIEPDPGRFDWAWLDRAVATLHDAGLKIILGTPTATPPKWLIDAYPDVLARDAHGHPRHFGSRRHYCFSSQTYARESARITLALATRYGQHPGLVMWQTDNEFGCHDTVLSYSDAAKAAFRDWLAARYGTIDALNSAWGNVFWSMEYRGFAEVDPPGATVTEANPAHRLAWQRFSSDQVRNFHAAQAAIIRTHSPGRDITHNFMGHFTDFDHHAFAASDLDIATWDSYPLGFLEQVWWSDADKTRYARTGHPDFAGFHHDLYRGLLPSGRWGIMEQQPGPVNWGRYNPAPLPGMVRLWTLEAAAHGAEFVSYFRWRQAPFGQEQMHAGLNRADNQPDIASDEAASAREALGKIGPLGPAGRADVALIYDYQSDWAVQIQPQGRGYNYQELAFVFYRALRRLGLSVDIVGPQASLAGYRLVVVPGNLLCDTVQAGSDAQILLGPRTGSKTAEFQHRPDVAHGPLGGELGLTVLRAESLRPGLTVPGEYKGKTFETPRWREFASSKQTPLAHYADGFGAVFQAGRTTYLTGWPSDELLTPLIIDLAETAGIAVRLVPEGIRVRQRGDHSFAFNYGDLFDLVGEGVAPPNARFLVGDRIIGRAGVAVWAV
jgi:beta-galactosidase